MECIYWKITFNNFWGHLVKLNTFIVKFESDQLYGILSAFYDFWGPEKNSVKSRDC